MPSVYLFYQYITKKFKEENCGLWRENIVSIRKEDIVSAQIKNTGDLKRHYLDEFNKVEIDLSTNEVATSPLELDDETLTASASVLANMLLDFVRDNGSYDNLTPKNVFRKENKQ